MEQPPNLDQFFRERLHDADAPPPAFVWPRVEAELRRRRRRFFLWLWLGAGLAGAGLWGLWRVDTPTTSSFTVAPKVEQRSAFEWFQLDKQAEGSTRSTRAIPIYPSQPADAQNNSKSKSPQALVSQSTGPTKTRLRPMAAQVTTSPVASLISAEKGSLAPALVEIASLAPVAAPVSFLPKLESSIMLPTPGLVLPKAKPFLFKKKKPLKNCYDFARHPQVWLVDAYVGPSLPQRQLTATQTEFDDYLQQRRGTERGSWAFNGGLRGSLVFKQHFLLRTGVHYEQMTEVFEYADPDFLKVSIVYLTKYIDNLPVTVIDTIVEYGEHQVKTYNRFGMLDVPLLVGAEFRHGRVGISLQAGASLNVWFWKRGTILNAQGNPERFTPGDPVARPVFRQRAGWSATASTQMFYHLRPRVRVFAEPYYSRSFRPLTLSGQPIAQRYTTWGVKLGVTSIFD